VEFDPADASVAIHSAISTAPAVGAGPAVERRLNPALELMLVPLIAGMMLCGLAGFARS
jgi:hypothetical protein